MENCLPIKTKSGIIPCLKQGRQRPCKTAALWFQTPLTTAKFLKIFVKRLLNIINTAEMNTLAQSLVVSFVAYWGEFCKHNHFNLIARDYVATVSPCKLQIV